MDKMAITLPNRISKIHPWKFALWLGCASMTMMFAAWTSAFIVRQAAGNWLEYKIPNIFFLNTLVIALSSVTIQIAYTAFKKEKEKLYKGLLIATLILGIAFIILQYIGWQNLRESGVTLTGNPSGSFIFVLSGMHMAHLFAGIAALVIAIVHGFVLKFKPTPHRILRLELTVTFWHFIDFLWIYLFVFLLLQL